MRCPLCQQNIKIQGKFCPKCGKQIFGLPVQPGESLDAPPPPQPAPPPTPPAPPQPQPPAPTPPQPLNVPLAPRPQPAPIPGPRRSPFAPPPPGAGSDDDTLDIVLEPMDEVGDFGPPQPHRPAPAPMTGSVPATTPTAAEIGKTCPYCRFPIKMGAPIVVCDACKTPHHQDCWQENGGCTSYGCARAPGARPQPIATAAGYRGAVSAAPRRSAGSAIADALILAELNRTAGNALTYSLVGILCCQIFALVGMLMGFSVLSSISRSGVAAPAARTKATAAVVIGIGTILVVVIWLFVTAQGNVRYR